MRINVDESFFYDSRIDYLAKLIGEDRLLTEARLLRIWAECYKKRTEYRTNEAVERAAQWGDERRLGTLLVKSELASLADSGELRICGVRSRIEYLIQASEFGKKSAEVRRNKTGSAVPKGARNATEGLPKLPSAVTEGLPKVASVATEPPPPSPSPPPDQISNTLLRKSDSLTLAPSGNQVPAVPKLNAGTVIGAYCVAWKQRYGSRPEIDHKVQSQAKALLKCIPGERLTLLIQAYLQMDGENGWFKKKFHDFTTFANNLGQVSVALERGVDSPSSEDDWDKVFKRGKYGRGDVQEADQSPGDPVAVSVRD